MMDRGYLDFARLYTLDQAGSFLVTAPSATLMPTPVLRTVDRARIDLRSDHRFNNFYAPALSRPSATYPLPRSRDPRISCSDQRACCPPDDLLLYKSRWQVDCSSNGSSSTCASNASTVL